mmetsp:Transcript_26425/g.30240  ORF Transcript_26425/g.30240 Transcript_26425/m.30240 type:complete len:136 (-) Transcript_26425:221-628(-)
MATRGIYQLQKLSIVYCEHGGSSRAVRSFISSGRIVDWAERHPFINIEVQSRNGNHPFIKGEYLTGKFKQVGVKNEDTEFLYKTMDMLKNSSGRKIKKLGNPVVTQTPSIQGVWTPFLDLRETDDDAESNIEFVE